MKMGFLLKNNARKRMGRERRQEKECSTRPPKFANSKTDGRFGRKFANFEGWGNSV